MISTPSRIVLIALGAALSVSSVSAADCERRIASSGESARTVVLAGGDAWTLFRQFLAEIEKLDLDVSLWSSQVQLSRNGRIETLSLGWTNRLSTEPPEKLWERMLRSKRADVDARLLAEARGEQWDVVCVAPPPIKPPPPDPQKPNPSDALEARLFSKNGLQYASRGDYRNALKEFRAAERISPRFEGLQMNLGVTYLQLKDYVAAAEHLKLALGQNSKDAAAHYNMACLQARLGQADDAIASLKAAQTNGLPMTTEVKHDPDLSSLYGRNDFQTLFKSTERTR